MRFPRGKIFPPGIQSITQQNLNLDNSCKSILDIEIVITN